MIVSNLNARWFLAKLDSHSIYFLHHDKPQTYNHVPGQILYVFNYRDV